MLVLFAILLLSASKQTQSQPIDFEDGEVIEAAEAIGEVKVPAEIIATAAPERQASGRPIYQTGDRCKMPIKKGVCRALIPRWSYDPETKECHEFKFGGCDGNANNFATYDQCMAICANTDEI